jgi:NADPH:quinone reductase-like Zn-dependent oxidoreductase
LRTLRVRVDVVIDTVGGSARERAVTVVKPGGILVTVVSTDFATMYWLRSAYRPSASADVG